MITGSQLAIIKTFSNSPEVTKVLDEVFKEQFITNSTNHIMTDVKQFIEWENKNG